MLEQNKPYCPDCPWFVLEPDGWFYSCIRPGGPCGREASEKQPGEAGENDDSPN